MVYGWPANRKNSKEKLPLVKLLQEISGHVLYPSANRSPNGERDSFGKDTEMLSQIGLHVLVKGLETRPPVIPS